MKPTTLRVFCPLTMPDGDGCEGILQVRYTPGSPGRWYTRRGDPGDPPEPPEVEITGGTCPHAVDDHMTDADFEQVYKATEHELGEREQDAYDQRSPRSWEED
jgi:hypothetical protein